MVKDGEQEAGTGCPQHNPNPSLALLNNSEQVTLPSQQQAIKDFHIAEATRRAAAKADTLATPIPIFSRESLPINTSELVSPTLPGSSKRAYIFDKQEESEIENTEHEDAHTNPNPKGKCEHRLLLVFGNTYL